ncbi:zinc finger protein 354B-like [Erpetoichthys calabaricus]|uniref:zinc finger protein 354B-like n=1 Tax=Erpetoichthys calabaricus TaxID=27687 RepID=UPI00109F1291|nr:zinc finger protein 354B-like [Erpetoichthys calabaricus]
MEDRHVKMENRGSVFGEDGKKIPIDNPFPGKVTHIKEGVDCCIEDVIKQGFGHSKMEVKDEGNVQVKQEHMLSNSALTREELCRMEISTGDTFKPEECNTRNKRAKKDTASQALCSQMDPVYSSVVKNAGSQNKIADCEEALIHRKHSSCSSFESRKSLNQSSNLTMHQRIPTGEKPVCGKTMKFSGTLKTHPHAHAEDKVFSCKECGETFIFISSLLNHQKLHAEEKPSIYNEYGASSSESGKLINQSRIHTQAKPFCCTECGMTFRESGTLRKHQKMHLGGKPYSCTLCGKTFSQLSNLKTHRKLH